MNLVYGAAGTAINDAAMRLHASHERLNGPYSKTIQKDTVSVTQTSTGGAVTGFAENDEAALFLLGALHHPAPGWSGEGSPVDDPDRSADYLLNRWRVYNGAFLDGVAGGYAVAIVTKSTGDLLLASDPYGARNWFIAEGDTIAFSSRLRALAEGVKSSNSLDRSYEDFLLVHGFYPHGRTPYEGVRAQNKGELLIWRSGNTERYAIKPSSIWRDMQVRAEDVPSAIEAVDLVHDAFLRATVEQAPSELGKVGVLLGGFDSALVASALHKLGADVETFSFHYDDEGYNQPNTDKLADYLGIQHHWVKIERSMIQDGLAHFADRFQQPTNWPNYVIQTAHLCDEIAKRGITHCYTGDGCDAVFMGYPGTYQRAKFMNALPSLPRSVAAVLRVIAERPFLEKNLGHPYRVGLGALRSLARTRTARTFMSFRVMDELTLRQLRDGAGPQEAADIEEIIAELSEPHVDLEALRLAYLGKAMVSPNRNKLIGSSDASGLAIFSPYMHPAMKAIAQALPADLMRPEDENKSITGKYILSRMAVEKGLLPEEIVYQPKMAAVDAPVDAWYAGPLRRILMRQMADLPFSVDAEYLERLLDEKPAERWFRDKVLTDKVISHAASMLATYASFTAPFDTGEAGHAA